MNKLALGLVLIILTVTALTASAGVIFDFESGVAYNGYNDVRIPGNTGTKFSLSEELEADPTAFWRARLTWEFGRNALSVLVAPLTIESQGALSRDLTFFDSSFAAGIPLSSRFRFDSYRLTYRYQLVRGEAFTFGLGVTGKIRDAAIAVSGAGRKAEKTNTGFVPLINFKTTWQFAPRAGLLVEGDALAAPQGRAEDILLALVVTPSNRFDLRAGYRLLEGGADNDEVYSFTLVNYLSLGIAIRL